MPQLAVPSAYEHQNWQQQLADSFTDFAELCAFLQLPLERLPVSSAAAAQFPIKVPRNFAEAMEKGNPDDPLLRQVLPVLDELVSYPGYSDNPVGDIESAELPGMLHKYRGRVLLINTGACAIHCRYCFRRSFPYSEQQLGKEREAAVLSYLRLRTDVTEVILSGGDPLILSDERLAGLFSRLAEIAHVKRIRIHSRLPIVLPARINENLLHVLAGAKKALVFVVHCNHANELTPAVVDACRRLRRQGITVLNQAVLLRGVNDSAEALSCLSEALFAAGVMPYYLHMLDKVNGAGHFAVSDAEALRLMQQLRAALPGYLVPRLVREIAGAEAKQPLTESFVSEDGA